MLMFSKNLTLQKCSIHPVKLGGRGKKTYSCSVNSVKNALEKTDERKYNKYVIMFILG